MTKKILVCDDDAGILDMMGIFLKLSGFDVISQRFSTKFFDDLKNHNPDLAIVDLWMPSLSGDEICRRMKSDPDTQKIPVIITSASRDGEKIALDANADVFLAKPFDLQILLKTAQLLTKS